MAITKGHGNPKWTRDETILALDLYFDCFPKMPSSGDPRVIELSKLLRSFPYHAQAARKESFRNPDGVSFKLQNLRSVATNKGLSNTSKMDRKIWNELGKSPHETKALANLIRSSIELFDNLKEDPAEYEVFSEGKVVTETHKRLERDPKLRSKFLNERKSKNKLICDMCNCGPSAIAPELHESIFEIHHIIPLSVSTERQTRFSDLALLCASCHRLIHKAISIKKRWLDISDAKALLEDSKTNDPVKEKNRSLP